MARYEVVREIENCCARNQMRDVFFDEIETEDPVQAVRALLRDEPNAVLTCDGADADTVTVYATCAGVAQKFLFTKI